ncbi:MAG: hypothetical protein H6Q12_249 [Bacteroidetes bacterium]|nr:hypothetical protein [Bacteroidota bacterium]
MTDRVGNIVYTSCLNKLQSFKYVTPRAKQPPPCKNLPPINKKTTRQTNQDNLIYFQNI